LNPRAAATQQSSITSRGCPALTLRRTSRASRRRPRRLCAEEYLFLNRRFEGRHQRRARRSVLRRRHRSRARDFATLPGFLQDMALQLAAGQGSHFAGAARNPRKRNRRASCMSRYFVARDIAMSTASVRTGECRVAGGTGRHFRAHKPPLTRSAPIPPPAPSSDRVALDLNLRIRPPRMRNDAARGDLSPQQSPHGFAAALPVIRVQVILPTWRQSESASAGPMSRANCIAYCNSLPMIERVLNAL